VKANECFQKALQLDPGYAPAWAGVAQVALRQVANGYAPSPTPLHARTPRPKKPCSSIRPTPRASLHWGGRA